jgi:formyl-CoA transferase
VQSSLLHAGIALADFQAARYLKEGEVPRQVGNDHPTSMPTSAYKTADGYINVAASGDGMWQRLCKAIGREELLARPEFKDQPARAKNRAALNAELNAALARKTGAEWIEALNAAGVPCGPIYTMDQVFADPQVQHIRAAAEVRHPRLGTYRVVNQAVRLSRTPATMATASPELGEHTDEVLAELGYSAAQIAALRDKKAV